MPKNTISEVIEKIRGALDTTPRSISDIATRADTDYATTERWLDILQTLGHVSMITPDGKKNYIKREFSPVSDTLFGFPIDDSQKKKILTTYALIAKEWKKVSEKPIGNTFAEKILSDISEEKKWNLPIGWYIHGLVCTLPYSASYDYTLFLEEPSSELESTVEKLVKKYSKIPSTRQLKLQHYREHGNSLYLEKENVLTLKYQSTTKKVLAELSKTLLKMIPSLPRNNRETVQIFTDFIGQIIEIEKRKTNEEILDLQETIFQSFEEVWKLVAMQSFIETLSETKNYTYEQLNALIDPMLKAQERLTIEQLRALQDNIPTDIDTSNMTTAEKKLWALKGSAKELSIEEKAKMKKRLEDPKEKSKILRELGFDD